MSIPMPKIQSTNSLKKAPQEVIYEYVNIGDTLVYSEKIDGASASFTRTESFSKGSKLKPTRTLHGLYQEIIDFNVQEIFYELLGFDYKVFGEWLIEHPTIQYKDDAKRKLYVFFIYNNETKQFLTIDEVSNIINDLDENTKKLIDIVHNYGTIKYESLDQLDNIRYSLREDSLLSVSGKMEGVVFTNTKNNAFIKSVNDDYKEIANPPWDSSLISWVHQYATKARVTKIVNKLEDEFGCTFTQEELNSDLFQKARALLFEDILEDATDIPDVSNKIIKDRIFHTLGSLTGREIIERKK